MKDKQVILIAEDEEINRRILKKILQEKYTVLEAENGAKAWDILFENRNDIDAVITDIFMPVMDGYALLTKIRQASMTELPTIVTTGQADVSSEQKALDAGAWDFVSKPYNPRVLLSRLRNAIARRQLSVYQKMQRMAAHDPLTGLHNRNRMFEKTRKMIDENPNTRFAFLRIDIDHFALYNTSFGETEGDNLLIFLAQCISTTALSYPLSTYGRISSDVFCICCAYHDNIDTIRDDVKQIQSRLVTYRKDYSLKLSAGVYVIDEPTLAVDDFYFRASIAAQKCKNQYETHLAVYDADSIQKIADEIEIANEMQTALDEEQFVVFLQPKYNLSTETCCGAEALVRWKHPTKGMISPGAFIPVFEKNGFIAKLDYYMWEKTCALLQKWSASGNTPFPVSVNISRISLYNPQIVDLMKGLVRKYNIPPVLLQLEVTESAYMTSPELMLDTIHGLREAGFTILMDDFGSGYSSLNTLKDTEVDILKIDMKFLPVGNEVEKAEIILASIIKMANWLGISVIVEGVETRRQRDFIEGTGCNFVQGYYFSRPIPNEEYEEKYVLSSTTEANVDAQMKSSEIVPKHNMTVLVIDDSEIDQAILQENFQELYHIHVCDSAEAGLAYLKKHMKRVKLILVDNMMPGMSGIEFLKHCQHDSAMSVIPKIMITANDTIEDQVAAFREGAYDYITKPLVTEILKARVNHVMEISRRTSIFDVLETDYKQYIERDAATGLLNKISFHEITSRILEELPEEEEALFVIDVDDFKQINDNYGHLDGDKVLCQIADELKRTLRKNDLICRFGGDEFVVLMTKLSTRESAKRKANEINKAVVFACRQKLNINVSISVGLSFFEKGDTIETFFARADQALYEAKNNGKGRCVVYGEKVPPILDDEKPVVLICGDDPYLYPSIALAYGDSIAFANISNYDELVQNMERYKNRICAVCLDMQKNSRADSVAFYQYILANGGGKKFPMLAACKEGDMLQLRQALELDIVDILYLPPQIDVIRRRLTQAIMNYNAEFQHT